MAEGTIKVKEMTDCTTKVKLTTCLVTKEKFRAVGTIKVKGNISRKGALIGGEDLPLNKSNKLIDYSIIYPPPLPLKKLQL